MAFSFQDGKRLWSLLWHKDEVLDKKRRWLMGSPAVPTSESTQRRSKKPKVLTNVTLPESYVRCDEVSSETVRNNVNKSYGLFCDTKGSNHVVQDYLYLFDVRNRESCYVNPLDFVKNFIPIINALNNKALCLLAQLVTDNKVRFEKTRPSMTKIIKDYLPNVLTESNFMKQLSQILRDASNFHKKQLTLLTPISPSLLSSIYKALEGLDEMPFQDLNAMNRKLRGVTVVPRFPPVILSRKRDLLLERVRKRCKKIVLTLEEGVDLPKPLAKALSVICLSFKQRRRCLDIVTSEFYPFSLEVVGLQNDILKALWSLPKVKFDELKALQSLVDQNAKVPGKSFRTVLKKYLLENLFEIEDIDVMPREVLSILAFLNRRSRRRPRMCSIEMVEEEVDVVLNVSSRLKQIVSDHLQERSKEGKSLSDGLGSNDDSSESNDFELTENVYCSNPEEQQTYSSCLDDEAEGTGDSSRPGAYHFVPNSLNESNPWQLAEAARTIKGDFIKKQPKMEQDSSDINASYASCPEEAREQLKNSLHVRAGDMRETVIHEICDETSLVSYRLIGHMLDRFLQLEDRDADAITRYYLRCGSSPPVNTPDPLSTSKEDVAPQILSQAVEDLLPSLPKSCIVRMEKLMGQS